MRRAALAFVCLTFFPGKFGFTQQPIGSIATKDALLTGGLQVHGEQAQLLSNVSVTAYSRTAPIELTRGGTVLVCSTSRFHILRGGAESSLVFALDGGAIEIHSDSQSQDVVMTPDLRMTFANPGRLDLRLRVTSNGDTCVENTGKSAPQIAVSDAFSDTSYHLRPGQHVLFEHGSLREVVDQEQSPCGCPAEVSPINIAEANSSPAAPDAAARNPFPAAVSQGLAPEAKPVANASPAVEPHTQAAATSTLAYSDKPDTSAPAASAATATPASTTQLAPPPAPPGAHDIVHALGHFFRRLFGGRDEKAR